MDFTTLHPIFLGGVLANNYALEKFLGLTPLLGFSKKEDKLLPLGLCVTLVTVLSALITWPLNSFVLAPLNLGALQLLCFVAVILILVWALGAVFKQPLGGFFPLIALNTAVLGLTVNTAALGFVETLLSALGVGLGFLVALYLMAGVQSRIQEQYVPKAFRGLPIALLAAAIVSMALLAF